MKKNIADKKILDACCGGRMMWFDKENPLTLYIDNRKLKKEKLSNRQTFGVDPDLLMDFRKMKLENETFSLVVFDPPHLRRAGAKGWMAKKYGCLDKKTWRQDLFDGFSECFRVLKKDGVLVFKWNEHDIPMKSILELTPYSPLFGHSSGARRSKTHWIAFMKTDLKKCPKCGVRLTNSKAYPTTYCPSVTCDYPGRVNHEFYKKA